jgi:hypothetical protein
MSLFTFSGTVTVDAASPEDALRSIGAKISATARYVGNGEDLAATGPFFTLTAAKDGAVITDLSADPIRDKRIAAEQEAEAKAAAAANEGKTSK